MVIHEFAEGIIAYTLVLKGGVKEKRAMSYAFLSSVGLVIFIVSSKLFW